jgi:anti-sigma B factor antagonist
MAASISEPLPGDVAHGLEIAVGWRPGRVTISVAGEWDLAASSSFPQSSREVLGRHPEQVVLDLRRLTFIDSSGIHATVELHRQAEAQSAALEIIPGPPTVQRPFELCGLIDVLPFTSAR